MTYTGFDKGAERFFHQLAAEMSREWFAAHKAEYEALWLTPMKALLADVRARLAPAYKGIGLAEPKVFRIQRDVRFAKDKAPYKTNCAGVILCGGGPSTSGDVMARPAAVYVSLGLEEYSGAGVYGFGPEQLARWRKALLDKKQGAAIAKLTAAATARGWGLDAQDRLARLPRGFPDDTPHGELARLKGLVVSFPDFPRGLIHKPALVDWLAERATAAAPLARWLIQHVTLA